MVIWLGSDIHSEFYPDAENEWFFDSLDLSGVDVAVLAGDILLGRNSHRFLLRMAEKVGHVVHVAGNHEFYHGEFSSVIRGLRRTAEEIPNYHFLEKDTVEIDGQRFVGATLWYNGGANCVMNEMFMNDFRLIHHEGASHRKVIYKYGADTKLWLADTVKPTDVVVTHMLPHKLCIDSSYSGDSMNDFYYSDCDKILRNNRPKLWLHGHSHNPFDEKIHHTRVVRNPHGYPGEGVPFNKAIRLTA